MRVRITENHARIGEVIHLGAGEGNGLVHRIDCRRVLGREIDVMQLVVTIDGQPTASGTRVTFVQVRDTDTGTRTPA